MQKIDLLKQGFKNWLIDNSGDLFPGSSKDNVIKHGWKDQDTFKYCRPFVLYPGVNAPDTNYVGGVVSTTTLMNATITDHKYYLVEGIYIKLSNQADEYNLSYSVKINGIDVLHDHDTDLGGYTGPQVQEGRPMPDNSLYFPMNYYMNPGENITVIFRTYVTCTGGQMAMRIFGSTWNLLKAGNE